MACGKSSTGRWSSFETATGFFVIRRPTPRLADAKRPAHTCVTMMRRFVLVLLMATTLAAPARAVDSGAAFEAELQRLSEILGALHYLRGLCGAKDGQKWRNEMRALIEAEAPAPERKIKLMASFNRGYSGFQQSYRTCTDAADIAIRRYLDEGAKISREITARYTN
jgi:uncharacterized protein (TIGR02301 family)